jgi:hypothetical protein
MKEPFTTSLPEEMKEEGSFFPKSDYEKFLDPN